MKTTYEIEVGAQIDGGFERCETIGEVLKYLNEQDFSDTELQSEVRVVTNYIDDSGIIDECEVLSAHEWLSSLN